MIKKKKKVSLKSLVRKADALLQKKYTAEYPDCMVCGQPTSEMHHFVPKSQSNNLRYDPLNLVPLCRGCHFRHHNAGDPIIVATIISRNDKAWIDYLLEKRRIHFKFNREYLEGIIKDNEKT